VEFLLYDIFINHKNIVFNHKSFRSPQKFYSFFGKIVSVYDDFKRIMYNVCFLLFGGTDSRTFFFQCRNQPVNIYNIAAVLGNAVKFKCVFGLVYIVSCRRCKRFCVRAYYIFLTRIEKRIYKFIPACCFVSCTDFGIICSDDILFIYSFADKFSFTKVAIRIIIYPLKTVSV